MLGSKSVQLTSEELASLKELNRGMMRKVIPNEHKKSCSRLDWLLPNLEE
jgi:hypothetical protein